MIDVNLGNMPVKIWNYGHHKSDNYGTHTQGLMLGNLTLFFSYITIVGFQWRGKEYFMANEFSRTTGKHMNILCKDKSKRLKPVAFTKLLNQALTDFKWFNILEK